MAADAERLAEYVAIWERACADFLALARDLRPEEWDLPTDLPGWSVRDNIAHTAHLEAVLAGAPEETIEVGDAPHLTGPMSYYTEQGVLARRGRTVDELCAEIEDAVSRRSAALRADPPQDGTATNLKTPGDVGWPVATLLSNRPLDVWMHEQDIRRAVGRPGGYDSSAAAHVIGVFARAFPMVVGKRAGARPGESVALQLPEAGLALAASVGEDGRAAPRDQRDLAEPSVTITMTPEAYVVATGGRRAPETVRYAGDEDLGRRVVAHLAVTP